MWSFRKFNLFALLLLFAATVYARQESNLELEHPELEQTRILPPDDASKELGDIKERIRSGDLPKVQFDFDSAKLRLESLPML